MNDLKFAFRQLLKNPSFTAVAVFTLALGIGANTAIFSVVNAVLLRPLPFREPERLVTLWERNPFQGYEQNMPSTANYLDWKAAAKSFEGMAIFNPSLSFAVSGEGTPMRVQGAAVSADLFDLLGVRPQVGRGFYAHEQEPGRDKLVIISDGIWKRLFAGDQKIIGKSMQMDGTRRTIVGIMPPKFRFPGGTGVILNAFVNEPAEVWVPLSYGPDFWQRRSVHFLQVLARLKRETTLEQAAAEMNTLQAGLAKQYEKDFLGTQAKVVPLREQGLSDTRSGILVLLGAVVFILLIACANVANLYLLRTAARQREFAIRIALGASRVAVFRQLLSESLLLSFIGGGLGVLLAFGGANALQSLLPARIAAATPGWNELSVDGRVLLFTLGICLSCAVFFALVPAVHTFSPILQGWLKDGSRGVTSGAPSQRLRSSFVVAQTGFAIVLLAGAALMMQSFVRLLNISPGFEKMRVIAATLTLSDPKYTNSASRRAFFDELISRVQALPQVESAGMSLMIPFGGAGKNYEFSIDGRSKDSEGKFLTADFRPSTPEYFRTLRVPLIKGRMLNDSDSKDAQPVTLINETFARRYFPDEEAVGKRITFASTSYEIVGVVRDFKHLGLEAPTNPQMYPPFAQTPFFNMGAVVARSTGEAQPLINAFRHEVAAIDKDQPIDSIESMETIIARTVAQPRFRAWVLGLFGSLALALAVLGVYSVLSNSVQQRTHEIGIRMAVGAGHADVLRLVIGQGMRLVGLGIVFGLAATFALTRLLSSLLYGVTALDPITIIGVACLLTLASLAACCLPALRATKIDPIVALRYE